MNLIHALGSTEVLDVNGNAVEVASVLRGHLTLLVFIRHFG